MRISPDADSFSFYFIFPPFCFPARQYAVGASRAWCSYSSPRGRCLRATAVNSQRHLSLPQYVLRIDYRSRYPRVVGRPSGRRVARPESSGTRGGPRPQLLFAGPSQTLNPLFSLPPRGGGDDKQASPRGAPSPGISSCWLVDQVKDKVRLAAGLYPLLFIVLFSFLFGFRGGSRGDRQPALLCTPDLRPTPAATACFLGEITHGARIPRFQSPPPQQSDPLFRHCIFSSVVATDRLLLRFW